MIDGLKPKELLRDFTSPIRSTAPPPSREPWATHTFWLRQLIGLVRIVGVIGLLLGAGAGIYLLASDSPVEGIATTYRTLTALACIVVGVFWAIIYIGQAQLLQLFVLMERSLRDIEQNTRKEQVTA